MKREDRNRDQRQKQYYAANFVDGWRKGPQVKECRWPLETLNVKEGDSYRESP